MSHPYRSPIVFIRLVAVSSLVCLAGGCIFGSSTPRDRIGALPFPGTFTLYTTADPNHLGKHRYGTIGRLPIIQTDEKERGIIYTRRAGFIDVAHIREVMDWTRYDTLQLRAAIKAGKGELNIAGKNHSRLLISLRYPSDWLTIPVKERRVVGDELASRAGQQLGYLTMTWHELITWYGYRKVFLIDEQPSAFTWDDTMSHMVGIRVAARALADRKRSWDDAVTVALKQEMKDLGAVSPIQTDLAVDAVQGLWWRDGAPLKRQFAPPPGTDVVITPWLIPNLPFAHDDAPAKPFALPMLHDVYGRDCSDFLSVHIEPNIDEGPRMRQCIHCNSPYFSEGVDLPALMAVAQQQMRERFGDGVNTPWPAPEDADTPHDSPSEHKPTTSKPQKSPPPQ